MTTPLVPFPSRDVNWQEMLLKYLQYVNERGDISKTFAPGQQEDSYSRYPYTPVRLDSRYGKPTNTPLSTSNAFDSTDDSLMGNSTLGKRFSPSYFNHGVAMRALNRLAGRAEPFLLTVSYHHPHAPFIAPSEYLSYY